MATFLETFGKEGQICNLRSNTYLLWTFGDSWSRESRDSFAQRIVKNK